MGALAALVTLTAISIGGYFCWYFHRPAPDPIQTTLFRGITYTRENHRSPRPIVVHIVSIDLSDPGIRFLVTPGEPAEGRDLRASTTSQFANRFGVQLAINAGFFHPWYSNGPLDFYPHVGDPVSVDGLSISQGRKYSNEKSGFNTLFISEGNRATIGGDCADALHAVSGMGIFVRDGRYSGGPASWETREPRTAVALDASGKRLLLVVVDGRQPNYSEGMTLPELANTIIAHGGRTALNLDGGGSSTLVTRDNDGRASVLNSPIHTRIPGRERPIANHLGIFAQAIPDASQTP